ncbi:hypothetical protein [Aeromonas sp.]|uniref:hypothetical protein n=1 Tax=Aeromonas sp. TaxID=647 RepID=UPI002590DBE5|nr:hypothetical protein [Aeromonas sp.]MCX7132233.1 hypothetical protein [Aeromonas sp.]
MLKKISIIICAIGLGYYFWGGDKFPAEGANHVMSINLYNGSDIDDCFYIGRSKCSVVSSILPNGIERAIAGNNDIYIKAMNGEIDEFIFQERNCEVLQRKKMKSDAEDNVVTGIYLMALKCIPVEVASEPRSKIENVIGPVDAEQDKTKHKNNSALNEEQSKGSFWN